MPESFVYRAKVLRGGVNQFGASRVLFNLQDQAADYGVDGYSLRNGYVLETNVNRNPQNEQVYTASLKVRENGVTRELVHATLPLTEWKDVKYEIYRDETGKMVVDATYWDSATSANVTVPLFQTAGLSDITFTGGTVAVEHQYSGSIFDNVLVQELVRSLRPQASGVLDL